MKCLHGHSSQDASLVLADDRGGGCRLSLERPVARGVCKDRLPVWYGLLLEAQPMPVHKTQTPQSPAKPLKSGGARIKKSRTEVARGKVGSHIYRDFAQRTRKDMRPDLWLVEPHGTDLHRARSVARKRKWAAGVLWTTCRPRAADASRVCVGQPLEAVA